MKQRAARRDEAFRNGPRVPAAPEAAVARSRFRGILFTKGDIVAQADEAEEVERRRAVMSGSLRADRVFSRLALRADRCACALVSDERCRSGPRAAAGGAARVSRGVGDADVGSRLSRLAVRRGTVARLAARRVARDARSRGGDRVERDCPARADRERRDVSVGVRPVVGAI